MEEIKIRRINELAKKAKAEGLTEAETAERDRLRKEYVESYRKNLRAQLERTYVVEPDGSKRKLKRKP